MARHAVIGLGQLGRAVALYLAEQGEEVIAIDRDEARIDEIKDQVARAYCADATDAKALRATGVADCATVVVAFGENDLGQAVLTTMELRELGVGKIVSRARTDVEARVLERLGVAKVVFPERQIGIQLARQIMAPFVHDLVPISEDASLAEIEVPRRFDQKTLAELAVRKSHGLNVVAVKRRRPRVRDDGSMTTDETVESVVGPETRLGAGDVLVVVGSNDSVRAWVEKI